MAGSSIEATDDRPRAIIHTRILDIAAEDPDASIEAIAEEIGGATPALVSKVLDEYGDPATDEPGQSIEADERVDSEAVTGGEQNGTEATAADEQADTEGATGEDATSEASPSSETGSENDGGDAQPDGATQEAESKTLDGAALSDRQLETLAAIHRRPEATQAAIAADLDVVRATVSNRLRSIEGFEWQHRRSAVVDLFGNTESDGPDAEAPQADVSEHPRDAAESVAAGTGATDGGTDHLARELSQDSSPAVGSQAKMTGQKSLPEEQTDGPGVDALAGRLTDLESAMARSEASDGTQSARSSPDAELLHAGLRAILEADRIDEDGAVRLCRHLLT